MSMQQLSAGGSPQERISRFVSDLAPDMRQDAHLACRRYVQASQLEAAGMLARGEALAQLKELLPHGAWLPALQALGIDDRTAQSYVRGYLTLRDDPANARRVADLALTFRAWALLTASSTPVELRQRVLAGDLPATEDAIRAALGKPVRRPAKPQGPSADPGTPYEALDAIRERFGYGRTVTAELIVRIVDQADLPRAKDILADLAEYPAEDVPALRDALATLANTLLDVIEEAGGG